MSVSKRKPTTWAEHPYYRIAAVKPEVVCAIIANPCDWEWVVSSPSPVEIVEQGTADTVEHAQAAADAAARRVIEGVIARMREALEGMNDREGATRTSTASTDVQFVMGRITSTREACAVWRAQEQIIDALWANDMLGLKRACEEWVDPGGVWRATSNVTHVDGCIGVHGYEEQPEGDPCPACGVGGSEVRS